MKAFFDMIDNGFTAACEYNAFLGTDPKIERIKERGLLLFHFTKTYKGHVYHNEFVCSNQFLHYALPQCVEGVFKDVREQFKREVYNMFQDIVRE